MRWVGGRRRAQRLAQTIEEERKAGGDVAVLGGGGDSIDSADKSRVTE